MTWQVFAAPASAHDGVVPEPYPREVQVPAQLPRCPGLPYRAAPIRSDTAEEAPGLSGGGALRARAKRRRFPDWELCSSATLATRDCRAETPPENGDWRPKPYFRDGC